MSVSDLPSHHRPGGGYRNPWPGTAGQRGGRDILRWQWQRMRYGRAPDPQPHQLPLATPNIALPGTAIDELRVTWIGHSSRLVPPGLALEDLPRIDAVVISHDHYDHMDKDSITKLSERFGDSIAWFAPL